MGVTASICLSRPRMDTPRSSCVRKLQCSQRLDVILMHNWASDSHVDLLVNQPLHTQLQVQLCGGLDRGTMAPQWLSAESVFNGRELHVSYIDFPFPLKCTAVRLQSAHHTRRSTSLMEGLLEDDLVETRHGKGPGSFEFRQLRLKFQSAIFPHGGAQNS